MLGQLARRGAAAAAHHPACADLAPAWERCCTLHTSSFSSTLRQSLGSSLSGGSRGGARAAEAAAQQAKHAARGGQLLPVRWVAAGVESGAAEQAAAVQKARRMAGPVGVLAGLFGSIVGVGGGVIIVPTIVSACKSIPQRVVSGTSLAAVVSTALVSAHTYASQGLMDLSAAALISPAAMLTAPLGARLTTRLNCATLRRILGFFLLAAAPLVPLKAYLLYSESNEGSSSGSESSGSDGTEPTGAAGGSSSSSGGGGGGTPLAAADAAASSGSSEGTGSTGGGSPSQQAAAPGGQQTALASLLEGGLTFPGPAKAAVLVATGAVAGVASGLLGVGGGLIVTPLLALTMPFAQSTVLGTSLLAMIPPASAALVQHHRLGNVDWRMAAALAAGTAVGSVAGSNAAVQAPPGFLEAAFCLGMLFLGRKTLATAK